MRFFKKFWWIFVLAAVLVLAVTVIGIIAASGALRNNYLYPEKEIILQADQVKSTIIVGDFEYNLGPKDNGVYCFVEGGVKQYYPSEDSGAILDKDENERNAVGYVRTSAGNLYLFTEDGREKIADQCPKKEGVFCRFSSDGTALAYYTEEDGVYNLNLYRKGKSKCIAVDVSPIYFCISPDGSTVGYITEFDGEKVGCYYDGKNHELGENVTPVMFSEKGKLIYYTADDGSFYVMKNGKADDAVRLNNAEKGMLRTLRFNADCTEVLYSVEGSGVYLSKRGGEREKIISESNFELLTPLGSVSRHDNIIYYGIRHFENVFFLSDSKTYRLTEDGDAERIVSEVCSLDADGKTLRYEKKNRLYSVNGTKEDAEAKEVADLSEFDWFEEMTGYTVCRDGTGYFVFLQDGEVHFLSSKGKDTEVTADSDKCALYGGDTLVYLLDGKLYSSTGKKGKTAEGAPKDIASMWSAGIGKSLLVLETEDGTFVTDNMKKFTKVEDERE